MFNKVFSLIVIIIAISLLYYLPNTEKVKLIGTEVKRMDQSSGKTKDVRFVVASDLETKDTLMYRNEDIIWPPYFKFDAGDLSGHVMNLEETMPDKAVLITYYGWRIPVFSMYPNATDISVVEDSYEHTPWFNIVTLILVTALLAGAYFKSKNLISEKN
jgi:hypothetical protein